MQFLDKNQDLQGKGFSAFFDNFTETLSMLKKSQLLS